MLSLNILSNYSLDHIAFEPNSGCWLWTGPIDKKGYGKAGKALAHRRIYIALVGRPNKPTLDHKRTCPKNCVNPEHLTPATMTEQMKFLQPREHCKRGHSLADADISYKGRSCRTCREERNRNRNRRKS